MQPLLRGLKACTNLRWSDFTIQNKSYTKAGKRFFYPALWNSSGGQVGVTLMLCKEQTASHLVSQPVQPSTLNLNAITEFCDLVPLQQFGEDGEDLVQATIVVLANAQVDTIQSYGEHLKESGKDPQQQADVTHESIFMMLQIINGLKCFQSQGVEELPEMLTSFIVLKEMQSSTPSDDRLNSLSAPKTNNYGRLCILQGLTDDMSGGARAEAARSSLCACALRAAELLAPGAGLLRALALALREERAVSLSAARALLELALWGPLDVAPALPLAEREGALQRWLDLERATVLHGLVRSRVHLNAFEQLHLTFLVRATARALCDASVLLANADAPQQPAP